MNERPFFKTLMTLMFFPMSFYAEKMVPVMKIGALEINVKRPRLSDASFLGFFSRKWWSYSLNRLPDRYKINKLIAPC